MSNLFDMPDYRVYTPPVYVGAWNWPEARFYMQCEKKPRLFHRLMLRWLLGIKWVDGDAPWTTETSP